MGLFKRKKKQSVNEKLQNAETDLIALLKLAKKPLTIDQVFGILKPKHKEPELRAAFWTNRADCKVDFTTITCHEAAIKIADESTNKRASSTTSRAG